MSQYLEAHETVTKDHLRAELALVRAEFREEIAGLRVDIADGFRRQQAWLVATIATATAVLGTLTSVL